LLLTDLVVAETIYVLESFYEAPRQQVVGAIRSLFAHASIGTVVQSLLLRPVEAYEVNGSISREAYLVACAESMGINRIASFDRSIDPVGPVERLDPPRGRD
jgi:predicted nucleic acid-binding protein